METYTIPQIVEQRICIAPMTKEQFERFYKLVKEKHPNPIMIESFLNFKENNYYRIYPSLKYSKNKIWSISDDYSLAKDDDIKSSRTIQFSQIDFEEDKVENPESFIGRKAKGFHFLNSLFDHYNGKVGEIVSYDKQNNRISIKFDTSCLDKIVSYPAELIHLHLVEEETHPFIIELIQQEELTLKGDEMNIQIPPTISKSETVQNEELDLTKILIEGETYYSPIWGDCIYRRKTKDWLFFDYTDKMTRCTMLNGKIQNEGECMIFPSKEIRTWENYSPFKKGEVCYFWEKSNKSGIVGLFYEKNENGYSAAYIIDEKLVKFSESENCERYDPSKFNF